MWILYNSLAAMIGTRMLGGPACRRNGSVNSSDAVARDAGSLTSIRSRKRLNRDDTL